MPKYKLSLKSVQWEPIFSIRTDGRLDKHDEANSRSCKFENAPKQIKICKIKLKYNYSIIKDFSSKTPSATYLTQRSLGQIRTTHYFLKKKKTEEDNKNTYLFNIYSSYI
jgi:hypothetical protein